jgi:hypothetical protein
MITMTIDLKDATIRPNENAAKVNFTNRDLEFFILFDKRIVYKEKGGDYFTRFYEVVGDTITFSEEEKAKGTLSN